MAEFDRTTVIFQSRSCLVKKRTPLEIALTMVSLARIITVLPVNYSNESVLTLYHSTL